jgi:hypothetical protein
MTNKEQIDAVLFGNTWDLASKYFHSDFDALTKSWTITKQDVLSHLPPIDTIPWIHLTASLSDGIYLLKNGPTNEYEFYWQERGKIEISSRKNFPTLKTGYEFIISDLCERYQIQ